MTLDTIHMTSNTGQYGERDYYELKYKKKRKIIVLMKIQ